MGIKKQIGHYTFGVIIEKIIPFVLIPFFTRQLGNEEYAKLILLLSYNGIFSVLIGFSSDAFFLREILDKKSIFFIFNKTIWVNLFLFIVILIISFISSDEILLIASFLSFFQILFNYSLVYYQGKKQSKNYVRLSIIFSLVASLISVILIYFYPSYKSRAFALVFSYFLSFIFFLYKEKEFSFDLFKTLKSKINFQKENYIPFIVYSFPLVIHQIAFFLKNGFDKILMGRSDTIQYLATYGLAFQLILPIAVIFSAFNKAFLPYIFEQLNNKNYELVSKILNFSLFFSIFSILIFFIFNYVPNSLYVYVFGQDYETLGLFLPYFLSGIILTLPYFLANFILFYVRKTILIAFANIFTALIHISLFILLNNKNNIHILGLSYLISQFVLFFIIYIISKKEFKLLKIKG